MGHANSIAKLDNRVTLSYHDKTAQLDLRSVLLPSMRGRLCVHCSWTAALTRQSPGRDLRHSPNSVRSHSSHFPAATILKVLSGLEGWKSSKCKLRPVGFRWTGQLWS